MIRLLLILLLATLALLFSVKNMDQQVSVWYFFGQTSGPVPLYLLLLGTFFGGMCIATLLLFPGWIKLRLELRKHKKILGKVEEELGHLKHGGGHGGGHTSGGHGADHETEY